MVCHMVQLSPAFIWRFCIFFKQLPKTVCCPKLLYLVVKSSSDSECYRWIIYRYYHYYHITILVNFCEKKCDFQSSVHTACCTVVGTKMCNLRHENIFSTMGKPKHEWDQTTTCWKPQWLTGTSGIILGPNLIPDPVWYNVPQINSVNRPSSFWRHNSGIFMVENYVASAMQHKIPVHEVVNIQVEFGDFDCK